MVRQIVTPCWIRVSTNKQMTADAPSFFLLHHAPCNLLIFSLGVESPLWRSLPPPCALPPAAALIATGARDPRAQARTPPQLPRCRRARRGRGPPQPPAAPPRATVPLRLARGAASPDARTPPDVAAGGGTALGGKCLNELLHSRLALVRFTATALFFHHRSLQRNPPPSVRYPPNPLARTCV